VNIVASRRFSSGSLVFSNVAFLADVALGGADGIDSDTFGI
jgi:hypothetical protein